MMLTLNIKQANKEVQQGLLELAYAGSIRLADDGKLLKTVRQEAGLSLVNDEETLTIAYGNLPYFFRGISYGMQGVAAIEEEAIFTNNGYMLDCSRNAVASVLAVKKLIRFMALMGLTTLQLYTEDTYELPNWPYFGYMRGAYTAAEIREMDAYGQIFGVELFPCVQTLAHINALLRWPDFQDIIDCNDILLVGEEKTYRLIDDMVQQLSACYTSRRIHIGMDEAHMLGLGKYLEKHGYQNRSEIMCNHLQRVVEICKNYGLKPMMWSDMFFRLAYGDEYYQSGDAPLAPDLLKLMDQDVDLVYWDYYHKEESHYATMIDRHKTFPNQLIFAGGAWKWSGLFPEPQLSEETTKAALTVCCQRGIKEVFATGWGDDGAECPAFSILPALQLFAEMGYRRKGQGPAIKKEQLKERFFACTRGHWDDFYMLGQPNNTTKTRDYFLNTTKPLLYQDVLLGLFDRHVDIETFPSHFAHWAKGLEKAASRNGEWAYLFTHASKLCLVLEQKCTLGLEITKAYLEDDRDSLAVLADSKIPELLKLTEDLQHSFESVWLRENKIQGLEVIQIRVGAIRTRLQAAQWRIQSYLAGEVSRLEELESERLGFHGTFAAGEDINAHCNLWKDIVTPGRLSW